MFWNDDIKLGILPYSQYHLDATISERNSEPWRLTCVCGANQTSEVIKLLVMDVHRIF
jgi:hypothetical protein